MSRIELDRRAFTLVETLMVLALIATTVSLAIPAISSRMQYVDITRASANVAHAISQARVQAIHEGRCWLFAANQHDGTYQAFPAAARSDGMTWKLPQPIRFIHPESPNRPWSEPILLHSDGTCSESIIHLRSSTGAEVAVRISRITGVTIE